MGETQLRGNVIQGDGVYKTTDAGKTWTHMGLEKTQAIARIRIHPTNPDVAYVAALGNPYGPNPERGVFRTKDGGKTWERVLFRDEKTGAVDLVMDPKNPDVLYAALWEVFRTPHSLSSGGPGERAVQEHGRRHDVDRADEERRAAEADLGQGRRRRLGRRHATACSRSSRRRTAASSCRTTPARRGS